MKWFDKIFYNLFLMVFISLFLLVFIFYISITQKSMNQIIADPYFLFFIFITSLSITASGFILTYIFGKKQVKHLENLRRLCKLIISNGYYVMEAKNNDKVLTYFPQFYFFEDNERILVTVKLDGSKFHDNFLTLSTKLEQIYSAEIESKNIENGYIYYKLIKFEGIKRLDILNDASFNSNEFKIPLMSSLNWEIIKHPHGLIVGPTGSGKTNLLFYLIKYLMELKCKVKIADPKMSNLSKLSSILGSDNIAFEKKQIIEQLNLVCDEINSRYLAMYSFGELNVNPSFLGYDLRPYFIVFDEFAQFIGLCDENEKKIAFENVSNIVFKGRQVGVFIIATTQKAEEEFINRDVMNNLGLIVSLGNLSKTGYENIFGGFDKVYKKFVEKGQGYIYLNGVLNTVIEFYSPLIHKDYDFVEDIRQVLIKNGNTMQMDTLNQSMLQGGIAHN